MTKHERDERDDTNDSQVLTGEDITKYRALVTRISYLSQDRPDLKFAAMQVCCTLANPAMSTLGHLRQDKNRVLPFHSLTAVKKGSRTEIALEPKCGGRWWGCPGHQDQLTEQPHNQPTNQPTDRPSNQRWTLGDEPRSPAWIVVDKCRGALS